ncbi:MAG: multicopper oxidase family protein [Aquificae bacterium]|nr:multicopper oxidase family protein [Aquificota bacterium]
MNRRDFLKYAFMGAGVIYSGAWITACGGGGSSGVQKNPLYIPSDSGLLGYFYPQNRFDMTAQPSYFEILPGKQTRMLTYTVSANGKTYYNPIIVLRSGQNFDVNFQNNIGEKSIIHWHGFRADWESDGHPSYAVGSGNSYNYPTINIIDRSGTYFYHPHPHGKTGYQVYHGLASMIIIEDTDEDNLKTTLDLQYGITDIPLIIQDKTFDANGNLVYNPLGMNGIMGFWGEQVLVNLTPNPYMNVERRIYRFRLLNGSNARPYRLVLLRGSQRMRFWVIGVEGGLLEAPVQVSEILIAPGERIDILIDFRDVNVGDVLRLYSLQHNLVGMGGMSGLINREFEVLEFRVTQDSNYNGNIPQTLSTINPISTTQQQTFTLDMNNGVFTINGQVWNDSDPLADYGYNFNNGDKVEIIFVNNTPMYHPMHLHGFQFQIISRTNSPQVIDNLAIDTNGRMATDLGWKDTVIVGPGETVKIAVDMTHNFGREQVYLLHCHILEHHDAGMMVNYRVSALSAL